MPKISKKTATRNKADRALQNLIRIKHKDELCWCCGGNYIQVGHHFITKSSSNALRYYLPNIIPLCQKCHCLVHCQPHLVEPGICFKLGKRWYDDLLEVKREGVKANLSWYELNLKILEEMING